MLQILISVHGKSWHCGATGRISASCANGSSAMFHSWPRGKNETCADILSDAKRLFCILERIALYRMF